VHGNISKTVLDRNIATARH